MLSQFLWLFGFFALVLVAVFWINRAVSLFDTVIGDGQGALVFLEFSALALPRLMLTVLPIATFAAAVYVTHRLNTESELTVMFATGSSPWRLARPVVVFGLISALMVAILAHLLVPAAKTQLRERETEVAQNVTARLLTEGTFLSPTGGVTFYTREIGEDGVLRDVFLSDQRNAEERLTYTAAEAYLVRDGDQTNLIMIDGLAQRLMAEDQRLSTAKFQDFSFDITNLVAREATQSLRIDHLTTPVLLRDWSLLERFASPGAIAEELHSRIARPAFALVTALIGFATLLVGGYSRFGVWREVVIAFSLLVFIDGLNGVVAAEVLADARLWPLMYAPAGLAALLTCALLWTAAHPGWWKGRRAA